mgnify:FL=1
MKITRRQLRKIILKEFRKLDIIDNGSKKFDIRKNFNDDNDGPRDPSDDEGGGPGKDWAAELIKRLQNKKGYTPMGGNSTAVKVLNMGESMIYAQYVSSAGVVIHLHARNDHYDRHRTDEELAQRGPMMIASTKFESCDNGMDVNKVMDKISRLKEKIISMKGAMIYSDLEKLRPRVSNDKNDEFDPNAILNNDEYLIDYYAR